MDDTAAVVLLGVVAFGSLVQAVFLVVFAVHARRAMGRLEALQARLGDALSPVVHDLTRATAHLAQVSDRAAEQTRRLGKLAAHVSDRVSARPGSVEGGRAPARLATVLAAARGVKTAVEFYRRRRRSG